MSNAAMRSGSKARLLPWGAVALIGLAALALPAFGGKPGPVAPPAVKGLVVLFSGKADEMKTNWLQGDQPAHWEIKDGAMVSGGGSIVTKEKYKDFQLHVEFKVPLMPDAHGQERGNSGIGLQDRYEIQVLDSFGFARPGKGDCGALYNIAAPLVNACKPPREWQTYDITFRAPRYDADSKKTVNVRVSVMQNGIVVQNNTEITDATGIGIGKEENSDGPIELQDHGTKVEFRNIWILPLPEKGSDDYDPH